MDDDSIDCQLTGMKCGESDRSHMSQKFSCGGDMSMGLGLRSLEISLIEVSVMLLSLTFVFASALTHNRNPKRSKSTFVTSLYCKGLYSCIYFMQVLKFFLNILGLSGKRNIVVYIYIYQFSLYINKFVSDNFSRQTMMDLPLREGTDSSKRCARFFFVTPCPLLLGVSASSFVIRLNFRLTYK